VRLNQQGQPRHRVYCANHSAAMRAKDQRDWLARQEAATAPPGPGPGRPPGSGKDGGGKREEKRRAALAAYEARQEEYRALAAIRGNLEAARTLADTARRREKLKRIRANAMRALHVVRLRDPAASLSRLEREAALKAAGLGPAEIAAHLLPASPPPPPLPEASEHGEGSAMEAVEEQQPLLAAAELPVAQPLHQLQQQQRMDVEVPDHAEPAQGGGRPRRGAGQATAQPPQQQKQKQQPPALAKRERGAPAVNEPGSPRGDAKRIKSAPAPGLSRPASHPPPVNDSLRERELTSKEAETLNSQLPPRFKYVPVDYMPAQQAQQQQGTAVLEGTETKETEGKDGESSRPSTRSSSRMPKPKAGK
jgi:hypothetical protein